MKMKKLLTSAAVLVSLIAPAIARGNYAKVNISTPTELLGTYCLVRSKMIMVVRNGNEGANAQIMCN